jgi:hypothetical protein
MMAFIALIIVLSLIIGYFGRYRKFGFWGFFFASLLLTPLLGVLLLVASDRRVPAKPSD